MSSEEQKKFERIIQDSRKYAQQNGLCLNPDKKVVESLVKAIIQREKKYGQRYCPCRVISGDKEKDKKIICPCQYCLKEVEENGYCHCRLFVHCH